MERFIAPSASERGFNKSVAFMTRMGIPLARSRVLAVRGRTSGEWRTTPVNPLTVGGARYLVAPRGHAQWTKNLRVVKTGELRWGRKVEAFTAVEIADDEKPPILREYLRIWAWEVGKFFEDVDVNSPDERLREIAPGFPVFRISPVIAQGS